MIHPKWNRQCRVTAGIFIIVMIVSGLLFFLLPPENRPLHNVLYDTLLRGRYFCKGPETISPLINPVLITDLDPAGEYAADREIYARLIRILSEAKPAAILPTSLFIGEKDKGDLLATAAGKAKNIYSPLIIPDENENSFSGLFFADQYVPEEKKYIWHPVIKGPDNFSAAREVVFPFEAYSRSVSGMGHSACTPDGDKVNRRIPLFYKYNQGFIPSAALKLTADFLSIRESDIVIEPGKEVRLKNAAFPGGSIKEISIPIDDRGRMFINYPGPWNNSFIYLSFRKILEAGESDILMGQLKSYLSGSLVFISDTSVYSGDFGPGVFDANYPLSNIHMVVANSILTGSFISPMNKSGGFLIFLLTLLLLWTASFKVNTKYFLVLSFGAFLILLFGGAAIFIRFNLLLPIDLLFTGFFPCFLMVALYKLISVSQKLQHLNRVREQEKEKLIQAGKLIALGTMASSIAHEIANPNNIISLNSEFLIGIIPELLSEIEESPGKNKVIINNIPFHVVSRKTRESIDIIQKNTGRVTAIISELRNFYKDIRPSHDEIININDIIRSTRFLLSHELKISAEKTQLTLQEDLPHVKGNRQQLEQVFVNLILNACCALKEKKQDRENRTKGNLFIKTQKNKTGNVEILVKDEGAGIDPTIIQDITKPFFTTRINKGGTGLGLHICRTILEEHNGSLAFASTHGEKTVVTVILPALKADLNKKSSNVKKENPYDL